MQPTYSWFSKVFKIIATRSYIWSSILARALLQTEHSPNPLARFWRSLLLTEEMWRKFKRKRKKWHLVAPILLLRSRWCRTTRWCTTETATGRWQSPVERRRAARQLPSGTAAHCSRPAGCDRAGTTAATPEPCRICRTTDERGCRDRRSRKRPSGLEDRAAWRLDGRRRRRCRTRRAERGLCRVMAPICRLQSR